MTPHEPIDERLLEAMEACRPGSDDLADPAMAELDAELSANRRLAARFQRLQKLDLSLAGAIQDVPVPPGLRDRLLAALVVEAAVQPRPTEEPRSAAGVPDVFRGRSAPDRIRPWLFTLSGALAAIFLVSVGLFQRAQVHYTTSGVLEAAVDFFSHESQGAGELVSAVSPPWGFPASRYVQLPGQTRWRRINDLLESGGVAYEVSCPGGVRATLYVVRRTVAGLPDQPPASPVYGTAHCWTSAWQEGQLLYVLVVSGQSSDYRRFLSVPQGPVA